MPPGGRREPQRAAGPAGRPAARARRPTRASASCSPRSRAPTCSPTRRLPPRSTSARSGASTTASCACPGRWSRTSPAPPSLAQQAWAVGPRRRGLRAASVPGWSGSSRSSAPRPSALGYADEPYDALLEDYEPGLRSAVVGRLFEALRRELVPLADAHRRRPGAGRVRGPAPPLPASTASAASAKRWPAPWASTSAAAAWTSAATPPAAASARATAASRSRFDDRDFAGGLLHHPARGRARPLRAGPRSRALRHAAGRGRLGRHGRGAGAALGEPGRPEPALLGPLLSPRPRALPRRPGRRPARRVPLRRQPGGAVAHPGAGRRGDLQPPHHDPLRPRAGADLGRAPGGRPARRLERRPTGDLPRRDPGHRCGGLPAGRPLGRTA